MVPTIGARRFWQTQGMARMLGLDLSDALAQGLVRRADYEAALARCETCSRGGSCMIWLSQQLGRAAEAPGFCPNKPVLDRLAKVSA